MIKKAFHLIYLFLKEQMFFSRCAKQFLVKRTIILLPSLIQLVFSSAFSEDIFESSNEDGRRKFIYLFCGSIINYVTQNKLEIKYRKGKSGNKWRNDNDGDMFEWWSVTLLMSDPWLCHKASNPRSLTTCQSSNLDKQIYLLWCNLCF